MRKLFKFRLPWGLDWPLFIIPIFLAFWGIVFIFSVAHTTNPGLTLSQIIFSILGIIVMVSLALFDYRNLRGISLVLYLILVLLLIAVLFIGNRAFGASRWINLKIFQLQPSEIGKLILVLFLARFFADNTQINWKKILQIILIVGLPVALILLQPDFGTAMVFIASTLALLFFSKTKKFVLAIIVVAMLVAAPIGWKYFLKPYQKQRVYTFINPASDPYGSGYNVTQAKITVGSGGLWGAGIGQGTQIQLNFLPVAHSDFIFATIAESVGLVGSTILILIFILLGTRAINVAKVSRDYFGYYFAIGWGVTLLFQVFVNIGMNIGLMPVTGIPLPFMSSGGTSMLTNMAAIGILQSIYLRHRKITF